MIEECWAVIEHHDFEPHEDNTYIHGITIHHDSFSGIDAQKKATLRCEILQSQGLKVVIEKVMPIRHSLPYHKIPRREVK